MVPNIEGTILHKIKTRNHPRHGTKYFYRVPIFETKRNNAQSYHENAITVLGPSLYNLLPKYLRGIESVKTDKYKFELDKCFELIPDKPKMTQLCHISKNQ